MKIIECPRDAMQGYEDFIATENKIEYINKILSVGFDTVDFGSFVSPKAIPQMKDTAEVLDGIDLSLSNSKLLAIVANKRGAEDASEFEEIDYLGYPFSVSETFQQRNTNASIEESLTRVDEIQNLCLKHNKELVIYLSMGFGNPYGDEWSPEIVANWARKIAAMDIDIISLADTIGVAKPDTIEYLFSNLIPELPEVEFGAHFHTTPQSWKEKVDAAFKSGCMRFDGAIKGFGGCPMAEDKLTGNMPTENLISYLNDNGIKHDLNEDEFKSAYDYSSTILK